MFLPNSRYAKQATAVVPGPNGSGPVTVVTPRVPPAVGGDPAVMKAQDRLDTIALRKYADSTMFWHIADANTELHAGDLTRDAGRVIVVPEK